ncbi:hypothetical protein [Teichococcus vastitatis]|uniref:Uncharacterized protein n=1 Tax=Teichococcus vastitatis TaxID=2307076 RepID=A0ABS9W967_9PROT|nr:hypothetical protein [Pseudoroseomonas vastitatis]MCI0755758.1 hypothetical protein [Pseudoroseomonas vastitatis]
MSKAPAVPADLTSSAFWTLLDRWQVPDDPALELLGHGSGLTRKNT